MSRAARSSACRIALVLVLTCVLVLPLSGCFLLGGGTSEKATPATTAPAESEGGEAATSEAAVETGDRVAAPWGGDMYIGSVTAVKGDKADVLYDDDGVNREVAIPELVIVTVKTWKTGDKVMAVWQTGRFYPGVISAVKADGIYTVTWDDGDTPSDVEAAKIYAP